MWNVTIPKDIFNKIVSKVLVNFNLLQFYFILFLLWRTYNSFILIFGCRMFLTLIIQKMMEEMTAKIEESQRQLEES
jgi:hypothetical protein